ncbi:MAG: thermonuclease family protein [Alphaproteobacteria bacterium]
MRVLGRMPAAVAVAAALLAAAAASVRGELRRGADAAAERALDGDTLALQGGRVLRLAGVLAPREGDRGRGAADAAAAARAALERLARGKALTLWHGDLAEDRHGRLFAQAQTADGLWLADELLRLGHARVFTQPGSAERAAEMLKAEAEARAARRGLWALAAYAVRGDEEAGRDADSFQIVEGRVLKAAAAREIVYLNFGRDIRRDFTVGIDRAALRAFRRAGTDPKSLEGKRIRIRGWVLWRGGPYIGATHPEQLEVLD